MKRASSLKSIPISTDFERFYETYYRYWEADWVRQRRYLSSEFYAIEGNLQTWKEYYLKEHFILLEYRIDTIPVGYLSYKLADKSIQIEAVLILPAFRQKGLMTQLLNTFLVYLESEDIPYQSIHVETNSGNLSNKVYLKFGFTVVETRLNDRENGEDTLVYRIKKTSNIKVPKLIHFHRVALIVCAVLMANPFFLLIITFVYGLLIFPYWFHKLPIKNKLWWTLVPISIPWVFWGILALLANYSKLY